MSILKVLVPVLAAVGRVLALDCSADTNNIQNQGDAKALASCSSLSGDVVISSVVADSINLDGIQKIGGSLICHDAVNMTSLSAKDLVSIAKVFKLEGLITLSSLSFPSLTKVDSILWSALPALQQLAFGAKVTNAKKVVITNTQLNSLNGIDLEQADIFDINNNQYLKSVQLQLANVSSALNIEANGQNLDVSLPELKWAFNITIRNCSDISLPSLVSVNASMSFFDNFFDTFTAPNLAFTGNGGAVAFVSNSKLTSISLPVLKTCGGTFLIANNSALNTVDGFPVLSVVAGAVDFTGGFTNVSLPGLTDVRGNFNMQTSAKDFDCKPFTAFKNNGTIKGKLVCSGNQQNLGLGGAAPTGSGSTPKKGAAGRYEPNVFAMVGLSAAIVASIALG